MRLAEYRVDRYGPLAGVTHEPDPGIEVVYGPNESGKTLLLEALCRLLEPATVDRFDRIDRVDHEPQGFVGVEGVVQDGGDEGGPDGNPSTSVLLDGDGALADHVDVGPQHLQNVFVVRDSDLRIRDHHAFYDSVIERLGDIHTNEIEAVRDRLEARGRLTSELRNIASAAPTDHAGEVRETAAEIRDDLRAYVESARQDDVDALEGELVSVEAELDRVRDDVARLEDARAAAEAAARREDLADYRELSGERERLDGFTRDDLDAVAELKREVDRLESTIEGLESELAERTDRVTDLVARTADLEGELRPYEERVDAVERAESALEEFRERRDVAADGINGRLVAAATGVGGLLAAGLAAATAGGLVTWILLAIGLTGLVLAAWQHRSVAAHQRARDRVLARARDAGFAVETVDDVGPAIGSFHGDRDGLEAELEEREQDLALARERRDETQESLGAQREELEAARATLEMTLHEADVPDVETYRERVERRETVESILTGVRERLHAAFGTPEGINDDLEGPVDHEALAEYWAAEIDALVADVPADVDPDTDDSDRLADQRDRLAELEARREELTEALDAHRSAIERFRDRVDDLDATPFVDERVRLDARSVAGLESLADDLDGVVAAIERDAAVSRLALSVFDEIYEDEEQKLAGLFAPDGRASSAFSAMTGGRYAAVDYDPETRRLVVETADGDRFPSSALSHATRDQLYLAARLSLGEQLLGGDPGFFLMDDPFLPADRDRLVAGFETLQGLADAGWQVLYFTAKPEVGETMADRFDLPVTELGILK